MNTLSLNVFYVGLNNFLQCFSVPTMKLLHISCSQPDNVYFILSHFVCVRKNMNNFDTEFTKSAVNKIRKKLATKLIREKKVKFACNIEYSNCREL